MNSNSKDTRRVALLGSTGSLGRMVLDVMERLNERSNLRLVALSAHSNTAALADQAKRWKVRAAGIVQPEDSKRTESLFPDVKLYFGTGGLARMITEEEIDLLVQVMYGPSGLVPIIAALEAGRDVVFASKEVVVAGGSFLMAKVPPRGSSQLFLPLDSELCGLFQCLEGRSIDEVKTVYLTASGGPFLNYDRADLADVSVEETINHPRWKMGKRISVNSATLINKGLEIIETHFLFGIPAENIKMIIHPQSLVHCIVEFLDGSILMQASPTDMRNPILFALTYPERVDLGLHRLELDSIGSLNFKLYDSERFPLPMLCYRSLELGPWAPLALNAANDVLVDLFLAGVISFLEVETKLIEIFDEIEDEKLTPSASEEVDLESILRVDREVRESILSRLGKGVMRDSLNDSYQ